MDRAQGAACSGSVCCYVLPPADGSETSLGGLRFFAHAGGHCGTAPESVWHERTKTAVFDAFSNIGAGVSVEAPGRGTVGRWVADVHVRIGPRQIAIEIQRSHQTLAEYMRRQRRYVEGRWECYWLLSFSRYRTLSKAVASQLIRTRYGGKIPEPLPPGFGLAELPFSVVDERDGLMVRGPGLSVDLPRWAESVRNRTFAFQNECWIVV